jgi:hypothetical protein
MTVGHSRRGRITPGGSAKGRAAVSRRWILMTRNRPRADPERRLPPAPSAQRTGGIVSQPPCGVAFPWQASHVEKSQSSMVLLASVRPMPHRSPSMTSGNRPPGTGDFSPSRAQGQGHCPGSGRRDQSCRDGAPCRRGWGVRSPGRVRSVWCSSGLARLRLRLVGCSRVDGAWSAEVAAGDHLGLGAGFGGCCRHVCPYPGRPALPLRVMRRRTAST